MRKLDEIASDLKAVLAEKFRTVRVTAVQNYDQLMLEIGAVSPERMPAVIIAFERYDLTDENTIRELKVSLVLIDRYRAAAEDRALSALAAADTLLELFPPEGRNLGEGSVFAIPEDCTVVGQDKNWLCFDLGLTLKQGAITI